MISMQPRYVAHRRPPAPPCPSHPCVLLFYHGYMLTRTLQRAMLLPYAFSNKRAFWSNPPESTG